MVNITQTPLTIEEIKALKDGDNFITGNIIITLADVIDRGLEAFLDFIAYELTGSDLLMDIGYKEIGYINGYIILEVTGDVSSILEMDDEEDEEE